MNTKTELKKTAQLLEARGYHCIDLRQGYAKFFNEDDTIAITYDILASPKILPSMGYGPRQYNLRIFLSVKANSWMSVKINDIYGCENVAEETLFYEKEEFDQAIHGINDAVFSSALPALERIAMNATPLHQEYYDMLAEDPQARAAAFSEKFGREIRNDSETRTWCETWLKERLPEKAKDRPAVFERDIQDFLGFMAFCGELRKLEYGSAWGWNTSRGSQDQSFVILRESEGFKHYINVVYDVLRYWNCASDVKCELFSRWF